MKAPDEPPRTRLPQAIPSPLPAATVYLPAPGIPLPPLDESHWRFVFQRADPAADDELETDEQGRCADHE